MKRKLLNRFTSLTDLTKKGKQLVRHHSYPLDTEEIKVAKYLAEMKVTLIYYFLFSIFSIKITTLASSCINDKLMSLI